jgi:DNA recombination protein RmuC
MNLIEIGLLALAGLNVALLLALLVRKPPAPDNTALERLAQGLRREIAESARTDRQELAASFATFQRTLVQQSAEATRTQNTQIDAFAQQLALLQKTLSDTLSTQLQAHWRGARHARKPAAAVAAKQRRQARRDAPDSG